jgi:hypothetical protein
MTRWYEGFGSGFWIATSQAPRNDAVVGIPEWKKRVAVGRHSHGRVGRCIILLSLTFEGVNGCRLLYVEIYGFKHSGRDFCFCTTRRLKKYRFTLNLGIKLFFLYIGLAYITKFTLQRN